MAARRACFPALVVEQSAYVGVLRELRDSKPARLLNYLEHKKKAPILAAGMAGSVRIWPGDSSLQALLFWSSFRNALAGEPNERFVVMRFRRRAYHRKLRQVGLLALLLIAAGARSAWADDDDDSSNAKFSAEAAAIFNKRCTACHTFGKGTKVGPDLKGVNDRRKHDWLIKFIHGSSAVIKSGDPIATTLFAEFKQQRMPDWTDLSEKQINDILDYLAISGPDIKPADERNAELASAAEIENGRRWFAGQAPFKYGAPACVTCHSVQGAGWGGTLGPDLTKTYFRYQDRALTEFLRHPCFRWNTRFAGDHYLSAKESFSIKAFLRHAALQQPLQAGKAAAPASAAQTHALPRNTQAAVPSADKTRGQ